MKEQKRIPVGIEGVDELLAGGLLPGTLTLLTGTTGTGKCVHANTPIYVNGELFKAEELYKIACEKGKEIYKSDEEHLIKMNSFTLPSLNKQNLKLEKTSASYVYRQKYDGVMLRIKTKSGRRVIVTPEHPFIRINQGIGEVKAKNLRINDFIAVPRTLPEYESNVSIDNSFLDNLFIPVGNGLYRLKGTRKAFKPIKEFTPEFLEWLGMLQAEGHVRKLWLQFTSSHNEKLDRFKELTENLFAIKDIYYPEKITVRISNKSLIKYLNLAIGFQIGKNKIKTIPNSIFRLPKYLKKIYLRNYIGFDGSFYKGYLELENANPETVNRLAYLLLEFGIVSRLSVKYIKKEPYAKITISGVDFLKMFFNEIGFSLDYKNQKLQAYLSYKKSNTNVDVVPQINELITESYNLCYKPSKKFRKEIFDIWYYKKGLRYPSKNNLRRFVSFFEANRKVFNDGSKDPINELKILSESDIFWDRVVSIRVLKNNKGYVYDLTVPENHTFVAGLGGMILHNTIFGTQFIYEGIKKYNQPGLYVTFEEPVENIKENSTNFGWDFSEYEKQGKALFIRYDPFHVEDIFSLIETNVKKIKAQRVVIDSVSALGLYLRDAPEVRRMVFNISWLLRKLNCTSILVSEILPLQKSLSRFGVEEFVTDGIIVLYYLRSQSQYSRSMTVWKLRGSEHSTKLHPYKITEKGIRVYPKEEAFVKM